jgi:hypothetical protein
MLRECIMEALQQYAGHLQKEGTCRRTGPRMWREKDSLDGRIVNSFVVVFRTKGCAWSHESGCTMCGYFKDTGDVDERGLLRQVEDAGGQYAHEPVVKIFTSGSFLDTEEIPVHVQQSVLERFGGAEKIIVETRPEYVDGLENLDTHTELEVAMGLESASDRVLDFAVNKGFSFDGWRNAARRVKGYGHGLKVYILVKPPFLTESDALADAVVSARAVRDLADTISFNPVAVHGKTVVERLWRRGLFRPPWLWTVIEVLKKTAARSGPLVKCDVVAGGKTRGSHNCGDCDSDALGAIQTFSLRQDVAVLENFACSCMEAWRDELETGAFYFG